MSDMAGRRTILDIVKSVLPNGSVQDDTGWNQVCEWPPDLFATVATIAERSGLYSDPLFTAYWDQAFVAKQEFLTETTAIGKEWGRQGKPPTRVIELWRDLIVKHRAADILDGSAEGGAWKKIVFQLLAIADEACAGIGFVPSASTAGGGELAPPPAYIATNAAYTFLAEYLAWVEKPTEDGVVSGGNLLPYLPHSLCIRVPPTVLCVQPKCSTPSVGCTLRSLTHNLALLPSIGNVTTHWRIAKPDEDLTAFNILIVPYPYLVPGKSFVPSSGSFPGNKNDRAFLLDPDGWIAGKASPEDFADFLNQLVNETESEMQPIHVIILPETALKLDFADKVARALARQGKVDLFITGVVAENDGGRNLAAIYRFSDGNLIDASYQSKHHRWSLNEDQIRRYHLGHILDPERRWWEQIDVSHRNCYINLFRARAALSVLVCEDLARYDPVLTVMNAIGPNLVIALLMDGPQLEHRWPGRYATALADDPGSSVLTVTSLGMVARSSMPGDTQAREVALWKEPDGKARALKLPPGNHALLLTLTSRLVEQFTLDGRTDERQTVRFGLGAAHGIRHPNPPSFVGNLS